MRITLISLLSFILCYCIYLNIHISVVSGKCLEDQRSLLLQLKNNLTFKPENSSKLKLWNQSIACCNWSGVTCDEEGHVTGLDLSAESISGGFDNSSSLFSLQHLQILNLAFNNFNSVIPSGFNKLEKLTYLNLSYAGFVGQIPIEISQLTRLVTLDISSLAYLTGQKLKLENPNLRKLVQNLSSISQLYLDGVSITAQGQEWCNVLLSLPGLQELSMSNCNISGPLDSSLARLENLSVIILDQNNLSSPVPETFANFKNLTTLSLAYCGLMGTFPQKIFQVETLSVIDISFNPNLHGSFPDFPLNGSLQTIIVSNTSFSGALPHSIGNMMQLSTLDLSKCQFNGTLHDSLSNLTELSYLNLSFNSFTGPIPIFGMAKNLFHIDLSHNGLSGSIPSSFPGFLRNQSSLTNLDLSENQIQGVVPNWIWKLENLQSLNISHNLLTGFEGPLQNLTSNLLVLDLHYNQLQGPIPVFPPYAVYLDYSSNKFSSVIPQDIGNYLSATIFLSLSNNTFLGSISESICSASNLQVLDLSLNNISGTIPSCLITMTETLGVLNLGKNNLTGHIPDMFPASCALKTLDLHRNILDGQIPKSLANCTTLEILNLKRNQIIDRFPCMLKNISTLRVLVLRKNKFHGPIGCPNTTGTWHMLQIVDLAINNFNGTLHGKCFTMWEAMMHDEDQAESEVNHIRFQVLKFSQRYYQDSVTVTSKGQNMVLVKILTVFTSIDFSSNRFQGEIPEELMKFKALHVLNLSNNAFSGQIPSSIGNLKQLESLDLSNNSLEGKIPNELASLNFLSFLNLSFNQLQGIIPTGTQIQSFPETSFIGNKGLCGPPLTTNCSDNMHVPSPLPTCGRIACAVDLNFLSVELGFTFGIGMVIVPLLFWKQCRVWYWQLLDKILCWIFPQLYLDYVRRGGNRYAVLRWRR